MNEGVSPYRVLLIDDDTDLTRLLADELAREGFGAARCSCGEEGLAALGKQWFHLVVLDMMLPGMVAGEIQEAVGYFNFFLIVMACCLVTVGVAALLKIDPEFGKKETHGRH